MLPSLYLDSHSRAGTAARYPYDSRSYTYLSPGGMSYPAPTGQYPTYAHYNVSNEPVLRAVSSSVPDMRDGRHPHYHKSSPALYGGQQYGPGDWRPEPRSASYTPHSTRSQQTYLSPYHGHSAPVTPYSQPSVALIHGGLTSPWTIDAPQVGVHHTHAPSSAVSASAYQYTPARSPNPSQYKTDSMESTPHTRAALYRPRSEGKDGHQRPHGPPKAVLGGVGGKTWDELQLVNRSVSTPTPTQHPDAKRSDSVSPTRMKGNNGDDKVVTNNGPSFKGNPIIFRPPFPTYSPPDSPELPKEGDGDVSALEEATPQTKIPRKDAFPWPARLPKGPPESIPLPLSPSDTSMSGRRRRKRTGSSGLLVHDRDTGTYGESRRQVNVSVPDPVSHHSNDLSYFRRRR